MRQNDGKLWPDELHNRLTFAKIVASLREQAISDALKSGNLGVIRRISELKQLQPKEEILVAEWAEMALRMGTHGKDAVFCTVIACGLGKTAGHLIKEYGHYDTLLETFVMELLASDHPWPYIRSYLRQISLHLSDIRGASNRDWVCHLRILSSESVEEWEETMTFFINMLQKGSLRRSVFEAFLTQCPYSAITRVFARAAIGSYMPRLVRARRYRKDEEAMAHRMLDCYERFDQRYELKEFSGWLCIKLGDSVPRSLRNRLAH